MIRSFVRMIGLGAAGFGAMLAAQAASATTSLSFDFTTASVKADPYYSLSPAASAGVSLQVYGAHLFDTKTGSNNNIDAATAETYKSAGLGVLYGTDTEGNGTHQIDNTGTGTSAGVDMVVLVFSQSVTLDTINRANYGGAGVGTDTDASFMAYSGSLTDLFNGVNESNFSNLNSGSYNTGSSASSTIWLIAANVSVTDRNDAFKLTTLKGHTSSPASPGPVPEPATWAMMIIGMGAVGSTMRRRKSQGVMGYIA